MSGYMYTCMCTVQYLRFSLMSIIVFFSNSIRFTSLPVMESDLDKEINTRDEKRDRELFDLKIRQMICYNANTCIEL